MLRRLFVGLIRRDDLDGLYDHIAGLLQIQSAIAGGPVLKPLREWAISPDTMAWLLVDLQARPAPTIVEFGCGQSTVIFAFCLKHKNAGRLISFEHDSAHAASIRQQLELSGVGERVEIRMVPLVERGTVGGLPSGQTYDLPPLTDLAIDLALVDGPPYWCGVAARYHPTRWAIDRMTGDAAVYLDDTVRVDERRVVEALAADYPQVAIEDLRAQKGLTRFTRQGSHPLPSRPHGVAQ